MAKFFKSFFSSNTNLEEKKKDKLRAESEEDGRDFTSPYDTKRKLSISRSGRMKQNLWTRGKLGNDLYGEIPKKTEKTAIEYHVNKKNFFDDDSPRPQNTTDEIVDKNTNIPNTPTENGHINTSKSIIDKPISDDCSDKNKKKMLGSISEQSKDDNSEQETLDDSDLEDMATFDENIKTILEFNETNF